MQIMWSIIISPFSSYMTAGLVFDDSGQTIIGILTSSATS